MKPNNPIIKLLTFLLSILLFFILPIIVILSIPALIIRYFIGKIAPLLKPSLGKIVTTRSSILATDGIYKNPKQNILFTATFEGNIDFNKAKETIKLKVIEAKSPQNPGELLYPELQQYIVPWFGYYFWKQDKSFDINHHVKLHQKCESNPDLAINDTDVDEIRQKRLNEGWQNKKSTWEIIFIRNYYPNGTDNQKPHSLFIWRMHHSLADGYSVLNLFTQKLFNSGEDFKNSVAEPITRSILEMFSFWVTAPFLIPFELAEYFIMPLVSYPWRVPLKQRRDAETLIGLTEKIQISRIKEIKDHFKVSFSSVIFAVLAGAERDILLKKKYLMPYSLPAMTLLPIPGHSGKLRNIMTLVLVRLPIGESDPIKRLKFCSNDYQNLKKSHMPLLFIYLMQLAGSSVRPIVKILANNRGVTTGLSNFPGGKTQMYFNGMKAVDCMFTSQLLKGCAGAGMCVLSYQDGIRVSPMASSELLTKEDVLEMTSSIQKHIDILYQHLV